MIFCSNKRKLKTAITICDYVCSGPSLLKAAKKKFHNAKLFAYNLNGIGRRLKRILEKELGTNVNIIMEMKDDMKFCKIIMNPPYDKNLHLKILREAMKHSDDIVNLSPNFYEDYKKLDGVPVASDIEVIPRDEASILFGGIQLAFNLSIQHYIKGQEDKTLLIRFMSEDYKKFSKVKFGKSFKDVFTSDYDGKGVFVPLKLMTATWDKNKDHIVDKIGILVDGKTLDGTYYKDARNRNKDRPCGGIKFDTLEEAKAFVEYTETSFFIRWVKAFHTNSRYILSEYPFMLSNDEINRIEQEV